MDDITLPAYPVVTFLTRHGGQLAVLVGVAPVLAALLAVWTGCHPGWIGVGAVAGGLLWLFVQSYVEVLRILADALMPR